MSAYRIFSAYLDELRSAIQFCHAASLLRPRLNDYLRWEVADSAAREMFQGFINARPNEARVFQSVVVSLHAGFEQFILDLIDDGADAISERKLAYSAFDKKFPRVALHFCQASGNALASIFEPRAHWRIDYEELIKRLSTAQSSANQVSLYGRSFGVRKGNLSWSELEKLFAKFGFAIPWGEFGTIRALQDALGTTSKASTEVALKASLTRLLELRNSLAHSQGSEMVEYGDVLSFMATCDSLSEALSDSFLKFVKSA